MQDGAKVNLSDPSKLVYSTHNYGPHVQGNGNDTEDKLYNNFGFAVQQNLATVVPGEWGGWVKSDGDWLTFYKNYLKKIDNTSNFFWTVNPTSGDTGGFLQEDWTTVDSFKQQLLDDLNSSPP